MLTLAKVFHVMVGGFLEPVLKNNSEHMAVCSLLLYHAFSMLAGLGLNVGFSVKTNKILK